MRLGNGKREVHGKYIHAGGGNGGGELFNSHLMQECILNSIHPVERINMSFP